MARPDPHPLADPRLFGKHVGSSFSFRSLAGDAGDLAQRTMVKASAFPVPESRQRKNPNPPRVLLEGAEDSDFSPWLLLHIRTPVSVSCSTQCPETPTWRDECGNVHYQAGLSTAFTEVGPLLWWSAAMEGT